jgi:hypothetical protein
MTTKLYPLLSQLQFKKKSSTENFLVLYRRKILSMISPEPENSNLQFPSKVLRLLFNLHFRLYHRRHNFSIRIPGPTFYMFIIYLPFR